MTTKYCDYDKRDRQINRQTVKLAYPRGERSPRICYHDKMYKSIWQNNKLAYPSYHQSARICYHEVRQMGLEKHDKHICINNIFQINQQQINPLLQFNACNFKHSFVAS